MSKLFGSLVLPGVCVLLLLPATASHGQRQPAPVTAARPVSAAVSSNRFLFIVDTSAAMAPQAYNLVAATMKIIRSSASGQLHNGDTVGVWTFNEDVFTGRIPLQTWAVEDTEEIALRTGEFLRQQPFEKRSRFDVMLSAMREIIKKSDKVFLTVFILSDGRVKMEGTPFDDEINAQYAQCLQEMKRTPMPVVTVLQAKGGKVVHYTVTALPWPVVIPELDYTVGATVTTATPAPPVRQQPPPTAPATPATVAPVTTAVPTAPPPVTQTQPTVPPPVVTPAAAPVTAPPVQPPTVQTPPPQQPVAPITAPPGMTPPPTMVRPADIAQATVPPAQPAPNPVATPPPVAAPKPVETKPAPAPTVAKNDSKTAPSETTSPAPAKPSLTTQAVALFHRYTSGPQKFYYIGGAGALFLAFVLLVMYVRRPRAPQRISLISHTMDDQQR